MSQCSQLVGLPGKFSPDLKGKLLIVTDVPTICVEVILRAKMT